jgi:hypothetical protein
MPKARAAKRKACYKTSESDDEAAFPSANNLLTNLDLEDKSTTPKIIANAILSLLPDDATKQDAGAKTLVSAPF